MIGVFDLVNEVLEETYQEIPGTEAAKDTAIKDALETMSRKYGNLKFGGGPDYASPVVRFGYIFRYVTCHSNLIPDRISLCPDLAELFERDKVSVTCLGGGPGSDVVGILSYLLSHGKNPAILFYICDRERHWMDSWGDLGMKVGTFLPMSAPYLEHDAMKPGTWTPTKYLRSDLFTLIYFMSELYSARGYAEPYFDHVFASANPGALFLYVDNRDSDFSGWFEQLAAKHGLEIVDSGDMVAKMPGHEQKSVLGKWTSKFGTWPKLDARVDYRVARKK
ncbi:hypothetical protein [Sorangium sp. So ce1097]|uniref:hypothetical protein n=1 Tax=Sorangium sp. So ce1097 TaxID=3133330 RepID=UPI003F6184C9